MTVSPVVHFADLVRNAGIKKHPFGNGRFSGINVRDDADIANFFYRIISGHILPSEMSEGFVGVGHSMRI